MNVVKAYWKPVAAGMVGVVLALSLWHAWMDHQALHQIVGMINESARQQAAAQHAPGK